MLKWHGEAVRTKVVGNVDARMEKACIHLKNRIRESESRSQPTVGAGVNKRGLDPSLPGEYPKIVTGNERRNVQHEYDKGLHAGRVGSNVLYAKFQETTADPKRRRPWLSNALRDFMGELRQFFTGGGDISTGGTP